MLHQGKVKAENVTKHRDHPPFEDLKNEQHDEGEEDEDEEDEDSDDD